MMHKPALRLVAEYGQLTATPACVQTPSTEYPYTPLYRPFIVADKQEETVHAVKLLVWKDARDYDVWGLPYSGITVWDISSTSLIFNCYGYIVTIQGRNLKDWRFTDAFGKHRVKAICEWNAGVHDSPPAGRPCITKISREEG